MKYALHKNQRIAPDKDTKDAVCPVCGELVIPKCGKIKMHHWAHKTSKNCDPWWENETEWHRKWKDQFSEEFQEYLMIDSNTGEKHIADIRTDNGFVIEFQYSSIKSEEKEARELFYKNMVWVVDASKYYDKFKQALDADSLRHCKTNKNYFYIEEVLFENTIRFLPKSWLKSSVPVLFDFGINNMTDDDYDKQKGWLYCIFPEKYAKNSLDTTYCGIYLRKKDFLNKIIDNNRFFPNIVLKELEIIEQEKKEKIEREWRKQEEEYEKEQRKQNQIKYANHKVWRDAIHDVKIALEKNNLDIVRLFVTDDGKITDYEKEEACNNMEAMALSIKSYEDFYKGKTYIKNEVLLLINFDGIFIAGVIYVPSSLLEEMLWGSYNFYIRKLDVMPYYSKYQIIFFESERIYSTKETRKDLDFILEKFANS